MKKKKKKKKIKELKARCGDLMNDNAKLRHQIREIRRIIGGGDHNISATGEYGDGNASR